MTRHKPWRHLHPDAVVVDRRTKWGNPFKAGKVVILTGKRAGQTLDTAGVVELFRDRLAKDERVAAMVRRELAGKDLACWCPPGEPCHADVLLEIANRP